MADVDKDTSAETEMGKLMSKLIMDPKTRKDTLKLVKKVEPERILPEVEVDEVIQAATAPLQKKIDDMQADREKERQLANLDSRRAPLRAKGLSSEEIKNVEQFMVDKKIGDHEIALQVMKQNEKPATPATRFGVPTLPGSGNKDDALYKNPRQHMRTSLHSMIDDLKAGKPI